MTTVGRAAPVVLDAGHRRCVEVLLLLRRVIAEHPPGTVIQVSSTDPAAGIDLPAWCHLTGHTWLGAVTDAERPTYALRTTADPAQTRPTAPWHPSP